MNQSSTAPWQRKLSRSLKDFLRGDTAETRSVLIALMAPRMSFSDSRGRPVSDLRGRQDTKLRFAEPTINLEETRDSIRALLAPDGQPTDMQSFGNGYFTASVTREQLEQLAQIPGVASISENIPSLGPAAPPQRGR